MKETNAIAKRRPRQNIISIILSKTKQKSSGSTGTTTASTSRSGNSSQRDSPTDAERTSKSSNKASPSLSSTPFGLSDSSSKLKSKQRAILKSAIEFGRVSNSFKKNGTKHSFLKGQKAFYRGPKGVEKVTIVGIHHDAKLEPYFTIQLRDGKEKQMDGKHLTPVLTVDDRKSTGKNGDNSNNSNDGKTVNSKDRKHEEATSSRIRREELNDSYQDCKLNKNICEQEKKMNEAAPSKSTTIHSEDRFQRGQDAYYRSPSGNSVTKVKIVEVLPSISNVDEIQTTQYSISMRDGTLKQIDDCHLVSLMDLTSEELAMLMKEKNEQQKTSNQQSDYHSKENEDKSGTSGADDDDDERLNSKLTSSLTSKASSSFMVPSISDHDNVVDAIDGNSSSPSPNGNTKNSNKPQFLALPCAFEMVEVRCESGGTRMAPRYKAGLDIYYRGPKGIVPAQILDSHLDDLMEPYYTIRFDDGREKQTDNAHISLEKPTEEDKRANEEVETKDDLNDVHHEDDGCEEDIGHLKGQVRQEAPEQQLSLNEKHENQALSSGDKSPSTHGHKQPSINIDVISVRSARTGDGASTIKPEPTESSSLVQAPKFRIEDEVLYHSSQGDYLRAIIVNILRDKKDRPYYMVRLDQGKEKLVYGHRLTLNTSSENNGNLRSRGLSRRVSELSENVSAPASTIKVRPQSRREASVDSRKPLKEPQVENLSRGRSTSRRNFNLSTSGPPTSREVSIDSQKPSRDVSLDSRRSQGKSSERLGLYRVKTGESRGRVSPAEVKEGHRSRSKSLRRDATQSPLEDERDYGERKYRERSRSRARDESSKNQMTNSFARKVYMTPSVSHKVQNICEDKKGTKPSSRLSRLKSSLSGSMVNGRQK